MEREEKLRVSGPKEFKLLSFAPQWRPDAVKLSNKLAQTYHNVMFDIFAHGGRFVVREQPATIEFSNLRNYLLISDIETERLAAKLQGYSDMLSRGQSCECEFISEQVVDNLRGNISPNVFRESKENSTL